MSFVTSLAGLLAVCVVVRATNYYNYRPYPYYPYFPYQEPPLEDPPKLPPQPFPRPLPHPPFVPAKPEPYPEPFPHPNPFPVPVPRPPAPRCPPCLNAAQLQDSRTCACLCTARSVVNCQHGYNPNTCQCLNSNPHPRQPPANPCPEVFITQTITTPGVRTGTPRTIRVSGTGTRTGTPGTRSSRRRRGAGNHAIEKRRKKKTGTTRPGTITLTVPGSPGRPPSTIQVLQRAPGPCPVGTFPDTQCVCRAVV